MLSIEEYIARRKKEDRLDEFNADVRADNMRICVNYVFEYFNNYLNITEAEERTALHNEKLDGYRKKLQRYVPEVREWLIKINSEYKKQMHLIIGNILKQNRLFLLYNADNDFRSISYDCYSQLIKKYPFLKEETEMLFLFIKDYHRVRSEEYGAEVPFIADSITNWAEETWRKHQISVIAFVEDWMSYFYDNEDIWPATHRKKSMVGYRKYDYDYTQKSNLFNLDSLYRKMPKKLYIKGRKQEFEILMMCWCINGSDKDYWQEYLKKTLPAIE